MMMILYTIGITQTERTGMITVRSPIHIRQRMDIDNDQQLFVCSDTISKILHPNGIVSDAHNTFYGQRRIARLPVCSTSA